MTTPPRPRRRRRRGRSEATRPAAPADTAADAVAQYVPPATEDEAAADEPPRPARPGGRRGRGGRNRESADRGLRELVGNTPSQLGPGGAMRGRDVNRPSEEDLTEAEREVVIVRRNWTPPAS